MYYNYIMLLYYSVWSKPVKWAVIYMGVLRVSMFASFYVFLSIEILEQIQQYGNFSVFHWVEHMSIVLQSQVKIVLLVRFILKSVLSCYKVYFSVSSYVHGDNYEVSMISGKLYNARNVGLRLEKNINLIGEVKMVNINRAYCCINGTLNNDSATSLWTVVLMVVTWWKIPNDRKSPPNKRAFDKTTAKQIHPTIFLFSLVIWISFENIWVNDISPIRKEQTMHKL